MTANSANDPSKKMNLPKRRNLYILTFTLFTTSHVTSQATHLVQLSPAPVSRERWWIMEHYKTRLFAVIYLVLWNKDFMTLGVWEICANELFLYSYAITK